MKNIQFSEINIRLIDWISIKSVKYKKKLKSK